MKDKPLHQNEFSPTKLVNLVKLHCKVWLTLTKNEVEHKEIALVAFLAIEGAFYGASLEATRRAVGLSPPFIHG